MRIWILDDKHFPTGYANGLIESKYPERKKQYLACTMADVFGSACERSLNVQRMLKPSIGFWEIGNPVDYAERANNRLLAPWALQIAQYLRPGENTITVEVASTPARDQLNIPQPPFDFFHEALEPTGMFGSVALQYRQTGGKP